MPEYHGEIKISEMKPIQMILTGLLIASAIGGVICGLSGKWEMLVIDSGLLFIVISLLCLSVFDWKVKFLYIFTVLGTMAVIAGIILKTGNTSVFAVYIAVCIILIFCAIGVGLVIGGVLVSKKSKRCTRIVTAKCVETEDCGLAAEYCVDGRIFRYAVEDVFGEHIAVNAEKEIRVNENKPEEFCCGKSSGAALFYIMGWSFIGFVVLAAVFAIIFSNVFFIII